MTQDSRAVPDRYRGVWVRTLLQTPGARDDSTFVRWLQTSSWHADLRVPPTARPIDAARASDQRASQTGFCGVTTVDVQDGAEVCTWHRRFDFQPPDLHPDAGRIVFETPDRLIETGVHGDYLEVWERLPGSAGRSIVLEGPAHAHFLVAGNFAMLVRPRGVPWPVDTPPGETLAQVIQRSPLIAPILLSFDISFGRFKESLFVIEHSTLPEHDGLNRYCHIQRLSDHEAQVQWANEVHAWRIHEWDTPKI